MAVSEISRGSANLLQHREPARAGCVDSVSEIVVVTPTMAAEILGHSPKWQRGLRQSHVEFLSGIIVQNEFALTTIQLVHLLSFDIVLLVDGQHRLHAIVASGRPVEMNILHIIGMTWAQARDHYSRLDHGIGRTARDTIMAREMDHGLIPSRMSATSAAVRSIHTEYTYGLTHAEKAIRIRNQDAHARDFEDWLPYAKEYWDMITDSVDGMSPYLRYAPIIAAGMITFRYQRAQALDFWNRVAHGDELANNEPANHFRKLMRAARPQLQRKAIPAYIVANAWRAHCERRTPKAVLDKNWMKDYFEMMERKGRTRLLHPPYLKGCGPFDQPEDGAAEEAEQARLDVRPEAIPA